MTPKFVVPEVATTAKKVSGPASSSTRRRCSPLRRQCSSIGTVTSSASMTSQADWIDECAPYVVATLQGRASVPAASARARAVCRAETRAERLPIVPPGTKAPPACGGSPARSAIQRSASFSAWTAPAPSSHDPA